MAGRHGQRQLAKLDTLASKGDRTIQIQVKARSEGAKGDTSLPQAKFAKRIFYVIVDLLTEGTRYYVISGYELDRFYYRSRYGVQGRIPSGQLAAYRSRWDLLEQPEPLLPPASASVTQVLWRKSRFRLDFLWLSSSSVAPAA